jgi:outer membrane protein OmpA-like peptidoglycan-associated protein
MHRVVAVVAILLFASGAGGQQEGGLASAQQVLAAAENAGARTFARSLYEDAQWRLRFAEENWNSERKELRDQARTRADEALWAGRAALAKSQWLGTNAAIRSLQSDIVRFGGKSDLTLEDEPSNIEFARGTNSRTRVDAAQTAIDQAKAAGAEQFAPNDLKEAQARIDTARRIVRRDAANESADHIAYVAEMMARRAYYLTRANESSRNLPSIQLERTKLAQVASEAQAAAERRQREEAQRQAEELQRKLDAEAATREAQTAELERLRAVVEENRRTMEERVAQDRAAREEAEKKLDEAIQKYQAALTTATTAEAENLRRQVEDHQIALRAMQERERLNEQAMQGQIDALRQELQSAKNLGTQSTQILAEREAELEKRERELEALRKQREAELAVRQEVERQQQAAIAEAQRSRQAAEAQAQALREQMEKAEQAAQQTRAELESARTELEKARKDLEAQQTETRRLRMQQELAALAATRSDPRGFIVTLPGIFFDTGKSELKAGAKTTLARIADQLRSDDGLRIAIEGHTDSVGSEQANQALSETRANAVRDFLVSAGIPAERITASGKGETTPLATNGTAAGRQQNRRVELIISP